MKLISRIRHIEMVMYRLEATFVKRAVVRYQRKALDLRRNFRPNQWKFECIASIPVCKPVNTGVPYVVKVRYRADEPVYGVDDPSVADNHYSHAANAASESVCGFKVYSSEAAPKVRHLFCNFPQNYDNFPSSVLVPPSGRLVTLSCFFAQIPTPIR